MRSFITSIPDNQEVIIAWKGKYIIGIKKVPSQSHNDVRYEYANNAVVAHDFFADDPYPGVLTIDASESSDPTAVATFETALRDFLNNVGLGNLAVSHVAQLDWWNARAAYYFTPFDADDGEGGTVRIVDQGAFIYDGANDARIVTMIDSNGNRWAPRAFNSNIASYLGVTTDGDYDLFEPEEQEVLELNVIDAWEVYDADILSQGLVDYILKYWSAKTIYNNAWGFGDDGNGLLCVVNSARHPLPLTMADANGDPVSCLMNLGFPFSPHGITLEYTGLSCPIDMPDIFGWGESENPVNVSYQRGPCSTGDHYARIDFHSPGGGFPDFVLSYRYEQEYQDYAWRLEFVDL